jgi:PKD repeat protein
MRRILLAISLFAVMFCSGGDKLAGTSNETQTGKPAAMVGLIVYSDSAPVNGANVILHDQNAVKEIVMPLGKRAALIQSGQTKTNINGFFRFDSVDTGKYFVEVNDHDTLGALLQATVHEYDTLVQVNGVLKRTGSVEGQIDTSLVSKNGRTYVYVVELQEQVAVDSTGAFAIKNLPPYSYTLVVLHDTVVVKSPLDTAKVTVQGGDTTHVGNLQPQVLLGVDTAAGIAPCTLKVIYKVTVPNGGAVVMRLDYGDGTADTLVEQSGSRFHVFSGAGTFKITLTADEGKGGIGRDSVIVVMRKNSPPVAQLLADTTSGTAPLAVKFVYKAVDPEGNSLSLLLDYGDGGIDTLILATGSGVHTYTSSGTYKMVLVAVDGKGDMGRDSAVISVKAPPPSAPTLVSPADGATNQPVSLLLKWNTVPAVSSYYVQVAGDSGFANLFSADSTLTDTFKVINGLANSATYYWRVRAKTAGGYGDWSLRRSFTTIIAAPQTPTLTSPVDAATGQSVTPTLIWSTVTDAATYHVQVSTVNSFATIPFEDSMLASTSKGLSGLADSTTYYWRVLAKNAGGVSAWTSPWSFTTRTKSLWTIRNSVTNPLLNLDAVTWGNNLFVAVSGTDTILTSPDGIAWTSRISGATSGLNGVAYGNNLFVGVGQPCPTCGTGNNGAIVTSSDGITWTSRTSGTPDWIPAVAWGDNQYIAVEWWLHISTDGITWTDNYSTNNGGQNHLDGITWGNNQFVAVGRGGLLYTSPDGNTWTSRNSGTTDNLLSVTYGNNKYIAVSLNGAIISSSDGIAWTGQSSGTANVLRCVTYANSEFVAVGDSGTILASPDGIAWTAQTIGIANSLHGVAFGNNRFVAVGANGTILTLP